MTGSARSISTAWIAKMRPFAPAEAMRVTTASDDLAKSVLQRCRIEQAVRRQQFEGGARPINVVFGERRIEDLCRCVVADEHQRREKSPGADSRHDIELGGAADIAVFPAGEHPGAVGAALPP